MKLRAPALTEAELQQQVLDLAALCGWTVNHHRPTPAGRGRDRWTTATTVKGWPDLVLWRPGALLFRELKTDRGRLTVEQRGVLAGLRAAGADVGVWRPKDWSEIERTLRKRPVDNATKAGDGPCGYTVHGFSDQYECARPAGHSGHHMSGEGVEFWKTEPVDNATKAGEADA